MHQKGTPWSQEEIETMCEEVLQGRTTIDELAKLHSLTRQRIQMLIGPLYGEALRKRKEIQQERLVKLVRLGKSDEQIAEELGISLSYTVALRLRANIYRPDPRHKWTRSAVIAKVLGWNDRYGYTPGANDWNPAFLLKHGYTVRAQRFYEFGAPRLYTVQRLFGSWSSMINESGLPPLTRNRRFTSKGFPKRTV